MITKTALTSPAFLVRVKAAIVQAVRESHAPHRSALGIGHAAVTNRRGRFALRVVWRRGGRGLECFDRADRDVTEIILAALRGFHAARRLPLMEVRELSPAEGLRAMMLHANAAQLRAFVLQTRENATIH